MMTGQVLQRLPRMRSYTYVWDNTLNYLNTFGDHNLVGLLGFSIEKYESDGLSASGSNFPDDEVLTNLGSAATKNSISSSYSSTRWFLLLPVWNINLKIVIWRRLLSVRMVLLNSVRINVGDISRRELLAWIISDESFLKDYSHIVSYLKLRASIGKTGSQNLGNYDWRTLMGSATYNNAPGIKPSSLGNDILQWESQVQKKLVWITDSGMIVSGDLSVTTRKRSITCCIVIQYLIHLLSLQLPRILVL